MGGGQEPRKKDEQESVSVAAATSQDDDIEPLSGRPFFHLVLLKSHINSPYQLAIPAKFAHLLPHDIVPVILTCGSRKWEMNYYGNHPSHKRFEAHSWKSFVVDNKLKIGDACVFELVESTERTIKFKVQILRGDFPSVLLERMDGTKDKPLVID